MGVSFIYGRSGSGKSEYIYNELLSLVSKGKKVFLIVPEQYTHIAEKNVLKKVSAISPFSIEVLSFERLCARINRISHDDTVIDSAAKSIIISKIISECELVFFKNMKMQSGFTNMCADFIGELKKYNITSEDLKNEIERCENKILKSKLCDICMVYEKYEGLSSKIDSEDLLDILYRNLDRTDFFDNSVVFFDEFSSFIPKEIDVIVKTALLCDKMYISLCTDEIGNEDSLSVFTSVKQTSQRLIKQLKKMNVRIDDSVFTNGNFKFSPEMAHLEKTLYSGNKKFFAGDNIKIYYDLNPYFEIKNTASKIVSLTRDEGYKYNEIGVVCSNIDDYAKTVRQVFSEYNIPCFIDKKTDITQHGIILFILGALDIYINNYSCESVFSYLNLGYSDLSDYQISILENYVLAANIRKKAWVNDDFWNYRFKKYANYEELSSLRIKEINEARRIFIESIYEFHESIKGRHKISYMTEKLYEFMIKNGLDKKTEQYIEKFRMHSLTYKAKEFSSIWDMVVSVLDTLYSVIGEQTVNVSEFRNYLYIAFSQYKTGLIPTSSDEVLVGNVDRSIHSDIKVLFVLGMSDASFPSKISEDVLFTNAERERLSDDGIELSDTAVNKLYYNRFLTYRCLTKPSERLYMSFSVSGNDNKPLRPSFVLNAVRRIFGDLKVISRLDLHIPDIDSLQAQIPACEYLVEKMSCGNLSGFWKDVASFFDKDGKYDKIIEYFSYNSDAKKLSHSLTDSFFEDKNDVSVSKLQRYRECKYSYFLQYMLKFEEREIFSVAPTDIGSLVHEIFEKICRSISSEKEDFSKIPKQYYSDKIDEYISGFIEKMKSVNSELTKRQIYLINRLKSTMKLCFEALIEHIVNSSFEPMGYEMYFGDDNIGSVDIKTKSGKVFRIKGIIDRADKFETENGTYIRIIDYKTGRKTFNFSDVFYGFDVQLIVYLNALVNSSENYRYGGALYFKIDDCIFMGDNKYAMSLTESKIKSSLKLKGLIPSDNEVINAYDPVTKNRANTATYEQFQKLSSQVFSTIEKLCSELADGNIEIKPYKKSKKTPCSYCPYGNICKFELGSGCYDEVKSLKKDEVFERLEEAYGVDPKSEEGD